MIGNPGGAILYGALDIVSEFPNKVKGSKYFRLSKFLGAVSYGLCSLGDPIGQLPFDISMAASLGIDAYQEYRGKNSLVKDFKDTYKDVKNLFLK